MSHLSSIVTELLSPLVVDTDMRYGNTPRGSVSNVVTVNGAAPALAYRVRLYRAEDGLFMAEKWSTAGTGAYSFGDLPLGYTYAPMALDHTGTHKPVAAGPLTPANASFVFSETVSADVTNYDLRTRAVAAGWDGAAPLAATVTIASGIVVSSNATSTPGFDCGLTAYPAGSSLALVNAGYILGMGGAGGTGVNPPTGGSAGGPAFRTVASLPTTIDNTGGVIGGGGGGGGGGYSASLGRGGGGGRTGRTAAAGGAGSAGGLQGDDGSFASGGGGSEGPMGGGGAGGTTGAGGDAIEDSGAGGGGWGAAGGGNVTWPTSGGAGGAAVVGDAYITWINTGTRYGAIT